MHPQRERLHNELHARPSIYFSEPAHLYHYAFLANAEEHAGLLAHLGETTGRAFDNEQVQQIVTLDGRVLKWERHTEFSTLTLMVPKAPESDPWAAPPAWLAQVVEAYGATLVNATLVLVEGSDAWRGSAEAYGFIDPAGSQVGGGDATVWGDFHLDADGVNRLLLLNHGLNDFRLGRMVRRLLEIETYRMMASLSLPWPRNWRWNCMPTRWSWASYPTAMPNRKTPTRARC
nr:DUF3422 family protein [Halomonas tianxiuensis]